MTSFPTMFPVAATTAEELTAHEVYDVFDKLDGHRLLLRRGEAYRRAGARNEWDRLPTDIRDRAPDFWLDGELIVPGAPATAVQSALAGGPQRTELVYRPFHIIDGPADPAAEHAALCRLGWQPPEYFGRFTARQIARRWPTWAARVVEGVVLRPVAGGPWLKLKRVRSIDLPLIGWTAGAGRLAGMIGALRFRLPSGAELRVSGLSDDDRRAVSRRDLGRMAEVAYQNETPRGSLQHARFIRWRDDLRQRKECEDEDLQREAV
jgi:ATP-dependent DNA ligase